MNQASDQFQKASLDDQSDQVAEDAILEYQPLVDNAKSYKYGFSPDPTDKRPYELSARCYHCQASFSIEN